VYVLAKLHIKNYTILYNTFFGTFFYNPVLMSVIFEYYADLKAMKYADLTAAMPLVLLYTPTLTHTHTGTLFFWFPVPHKIDTGNLCLL
jgi:hypothetical protein